MASKTPFQYAPLNLDRPALRLVRLKSAPYELTNHSALLIDDSQQADLDTIIECELIEAFYDVDFVPDYEAVSYTWGNANNTREISLDGSTLSVTYNLWSLLHDLRRPAEDRVLWIDAICIDQGNHRERGHQVQQMDQIYRHAERVVIWLGPLTLPIGILMDSLAQLQQNMEGLSWSPTDYRWEFNWNRIQNRLQVDMATLKSALKQVLERPWFRRAWVLQEVANARAAVVYCGFKSVSGKIFSVCPQLLHFGLDSHCQAVIDVMPGPLRRHSWWSRERDLLSLLRKFSGTQATRAHDRIFALFGLCPEANANITTDYDKPMPFLIMETVSLMVACNITCLPSINTVQELMDDIIAERIHNVVFEDLLRYSDTSIVEEFLVKHATKLTITPDLFAAAASNECLGEHVLRAVFSLHSPRDLYSYTEVKSFLRPLIESGNEAAVRLYLNQHPEFNIDRCWGGRDTPLSKAAELGKERVAAMLLGRGADPSFNDSRGVTPLGVAAKNGHESIVRLLIDYGAELEASDITGETALLSATRSRQTAVVQFLLDRGADCNTRTYQTRESALLIASLARQANMVQLLLDKGADSEIQDRDGGTPLFVASKMGSKTIVQLLLDHGANPDVECRGETPISVAMEWGHHDIVQLLHDRGARCSPVSEDGHMEVGK